MARMVSRLFVWVACATVLVMTSGTASAQYGTRRAGASGVTGEDYHVEVAYALWNPTPDIVVSSESLGIIGTSIDAITDLGFEKKWVQDLRIVLRPSRKFKFRLGYTPIKYQAETTLTRTIVFNGQRYTVGLPVTSDFDWKQYRVGIQWDFLYRSRGFLGFVTEVNFTDLNISLTAPLIAEFTDVKVPIPTIGVVGRVYPVDNLAITGELTGLKLTVQGDTGQYIDFNINATYNFTNNVGVQGGYRKLDVEYAVEKDSGNLNLNGLFFGGVVRF